MYSNVSAVVLTCAVLACAAVAALFDCVVVKQVEFLAQAAYTL